MATVISIANQKGGAGKTTTAINLSSALGRSGRRVMVVDVDEQATFMRWAKVREKSGKDPVSAMCLPIGLLPTEIEALRMDSSYDVVVIDCPGNILGTTQMAIALSDAVVCPVRATAFDFEATKAVAKFVNDVRTSNPDLRLLMFINSKHAARKIDKGAKDSLRRIFEKDNRTVILDTEIPDAAVLAEFGGTGMNIFEYAPKAPVSKLYMKLTKEVVECLIAVEAVSA